VVQVSTAAAGTYPLMISRVGLSTPEGELVPGALGADGAIVVGSK